MRSTTALAIFLVFTFATLSGCSNDSMSPDAPGHALAVVVLEPAAFNANGADGLLYATDDHGQVLGLETFTAPDIVTLHGEAEPPATVHVTLAVTIHGAVTLMTTLDHVAGDTLTYNSRAWGFWDHGADLVFENVPDHTKFRLSTPTWTVHDDILPATTHIPFREDPSDCFMRIDPVGAQLRGAFIASERDGDVMSVDLADDSRFHDLLH